MEQSEDIKELLKALAEAKKNFTDVEKGTANTFLKTKYASLLDIMKAVTPALDKHSLLIVQGSSVVPGLDGTNVTTALYHTPSGQHIKCVGRAKGKGDSPQEVGSAITYLRRYGVLSMLGLVPVESDDDGNLASGKGKDADILALQNQLKELRNEQEEYIKHAKDFADLVASTIGAVREHIQEETREQLRDLIRKIRGAKK